MPDQLPEISGSSIVVVGSFNPPIFHPEWFRRQGLLSQGQLETAEVKVVIPQVCHFETEQLSVQVLPDKFVAASKTSANFAPVGDLVEGTFAVLEHTPVTAIGLNHHMHFPLGSEENWHRLGHKLAPKEGWNGILSGKPGMLSLSITTHETEPTARQYTVKVEPSVLVKFGAYFETNAHYQAAKEEETLKRLMKIVGEHWEESHGYAIKVARHVLDWAETA
jgi:hypothetical protein